MTPEQERALALARARMRLQQAPPQELEAKPSALPKATSAWQDFTSGVENAVGGISEPIARLATSAIAKPVSDVAGLVSGAADVVSGNRLGGRNAAEVQRDVQKALTYEPRTEAGASPDNPLNAIPAAIGEGVGSLAEGGAEMAGAVLPGDPNDPFAPAGIAANATREAIPQAIGIAGPKYVPKVLTKAGQAMQGGAERTMRSALGPTATQIGTGQAQQAARTLLREGLNPSEAGAAALRSRVSALEKQADDLVFNSPETIPVADVAGSLRAVSDKFSRQVDPMADTAAIRRLGERFSDHPALTGDRMSVQVAHDLKKGTYQTLGEKYGKLGTAEEAGQKALAEALRQGVNKAVPGMAEVLAKESDLINALHATERRAFVDLTRNPIDIALYIRNPAAKAAYLANKSTMFKSLFARALNTVGKGAENMGTALDKVVTQEY